MPASSASTATHSLAGPRRRRSSNASAWPPLRIGGESREEAIRSGGVEWAASACACGGGWVKAEEGARCFACFCFALFCFVEIFDVWFSFR